MSYGRSNKNWHDILDDRSLEMDRVIAERIRANPKLVQIALANIERWLAIPITPKAAGKPPWNGRALLRTPLSERW